MSSVLPLEKAIELFEEFNKEGVLYCHWKSNEHLLEGLAGDTDLDVLVGKENKALTTRVLEKCGYKKCNIQFGSRYPNVEEWLGFDVDTGKLIHIHLHYEIVTGIKHQKEFILPWSERVLDRRILDDKYNVYITDPAFELIILKSRIILKMPYAARLNVKIGKNLPLSSDFAEEVEYLMQRIEPSEVRKVSHELFEDNCLEEYWLSENYGDYVDYCKILRDRLALCRRYSSLKVLTKHVYFRGCFLIKKIERKVFGIKPIYKKTLSDEGRLIAFIGPDGCGKSTVTSDIEKWLTWKIEASRFYLGSGDHFNSLGKQIFSILKKIGNRNEMTKSPGIKAVNSESEARVDSSKKIPLKKTLGHIYYSFYLISVAKRCLKEIKRADRYRRNGGIAILDRYPQTQFAGINDGPKISKKFCDIHRGVFFNALARKEYRIFHEIKRINPDVVIKLYVSPEESIRRKPDHDLEEVSIKADVVKNLVFENSSIFTVNTEQLFDDEILEIRKIVWNEISK